MMRDDDERRIARRVEEGYRHPAGPSPEARERLLEGLRRLPPPSRARGPWAWLVDGPAVPIRLAAAAAVVLAAAAVLLVRPRGPEPTATPAPAVNAATGVQVLRFQLAAPGAARVALVGDFNGWDRSATPMRRGAGSDVWSVSVAVAPGRHIYAFVVDGRHWLPDPAAPLAPDDGFGGVNSVVVVGGPGAS